MNNKYHILLAPAEEITPSGESPSGNPTGPAPAEDNFYDNASTETTETTVTETSTKEDFTDPGQAEQTQPAESTAIGEAPDVTKPAPTAAQPQLLKLDPESIAELRRGITPPSVPQTQAEPQLNPEQLRTLLNPVEVSEDMIRSFGFTEVNPQQVAAFQNFSNAVVKNAVSIARVLIQKKEKEFQAAIAPLQQQMESAQLNSHRETFKAKYRELSDPKYDKVIKAAASEVEPTRADGSEKTADEIFKEVAEKSKAYLQSLGVKFDSPANLGTGGQRLVPQPNKFAPSGRSGGDNNGQRGKPNDADADIYKR